MNSHNHSLLGEILIRRGVIDQAGLDTALTRQTRVPSDRLGTIMVRLGLISEQTLLEALSEQLGVGILRDAQITTCLPLIADWHAQHAVSQALSARLAFFAYKDPEEGVLVVGARDVLDSALGEYLESGPLRGQDYRLALVATRDLERVFAHIYRPHSSGEGSTDLRKLAEDAPIVELVNGVMARATDTRSSDVHVEPEEFGFTVRYRIDGRLQTAEQYPRERFDAVVSRIKLISGLDIAERRLPQDGRFSIRTSGVDTDVRVSVIPGVQGESLVLRLLPNTQNTRFDLNNIGIEPDHLMMYRDWMAQPDGIVLVTGPTGSGKSTTLYATLIACDTAHERVLTVEDPVEYQIPGVTQFQVHPDIGFTFPAALRSILRHDPDTIMIGEIRDVDTARIAVQASLTGHRVFSTLHTNDTATAFLRLADMGVEAFLVGATVRGVVAQRLVRRLCNHCARPISSLAVVPESILRTVEKLGIDPSTTQFKEATGCSACSHTGYRGRIAIYELMEANDRLRSALSHESPSLSSLMQTVSPNFRSLRDDGILKAIRGVTSIEEVLTIAGSATQER